ncbi:patatin-like phospholipase family protein [Actinomadura rayongensis]|uniref:Patatin-like phospholipase family protein n=1 Tax=Actinomadura rayongensis TaxID=1429076 RepID=A0A6I4WAX4_9ACTN|nr:patatin-like phospholipase family protein [Actinomadura rayongensis]MXQ65176.1 patatin-like phospholipase family protein [Actinomadura rayongensis]
MTRALVLAAGASVGGFWQAGLVEGLRRAGTDLGDADLIVGTSAGSMTAAVIALDAGLPGFIDAVAAGRSAEPMPSVEPDPATRIYDLLADPSVPADERRRRAGRVARTADTSATRHRADKTFGLLAGRAWPDRTLLIPAVDVETGERAVWRRGGAATLEQAVRASCAWPGLFPAMEIGGRSYMGGMTYSIAHADLAAGCDRVVVIAPLHPLAGRDELAADLAAVAPRRTAVVDAGPAASEMFDLLLFDPHMVRPAYAAGLARAAEHAAEVAAVWTG